MVEVVFFTACLPSLLSRLSGGGGADKIGRFNVIFPYFSILFLFLLLRRFNWRLVGWPTRCFGRTLLPSQCRHQWIALCSIGGKRWWLLSMQSVQLTTVFVSQHFCCHFCCFSRRFLEIKRGLPQGKGARREGRMWWPKSLRPATFRQGRNYLKCLHPRHGSKWRMLHYVRAYHKLLLLSS